MRGRVLRALMVVLLSSCAATTDADLMYDGNYAGTATTGASSCGTGNMVLALNQVGTLLTGTWSASGFSSVLACNSLNTGGSISGQASGASLVITLSNNGNSGTYALLGTATGTSIAGTYSQTMTNAFTTGTFTFARQ